MHYSQMVDDMVRAKADSRGPLGTLLSCRQLVPHSIICTGTWGESARLVGVRDTAHEGLGA